MIARMVSLFFIPLLVFVGVAEASSRVSDECAALRFPHHEEQEGITLKLKRILLSLSSSAGKDPDKVVGLLGSPDKELRTWNYYRASWALVDDDFSKSQKSASLEHGAHITRIAIVEYIWERSKSSTCKTYVKLNFSDAVSAPADPYSAEGWPGDCIADCDYILERLLSE